MSVFGLGYAGSDAGSLTRVKRRKKRRVLIIVQNLPVPFDRRVWQEARELSRNGYQVSIICPTGVGYEAHEETIDGIRIYRHPLPLEAKGFSGYALEYSLSLFWEFVLTWKVLIRDGFDVIHACNPPDNIFLIAGFFKILFGKKFLFDHHDIGPELYEAKFGRKDLFHWLMLQWEKCTFWLADISIATNNSYRAIAIERGGMKADDVFVVRSGPNLERMKIMPPNPDFKMGKKFLVGYLGVMGRQEGIHLLLEAAQHIVHTLKREDIHFTLIGGGPVLEFMKKFSAGKNLSDYVSFTGRIPDEELLPILNTADVCVNSDTVNTMNDKSTMNKIMEYMALGKPIVQFDVTEGRFSAGESSLYAEKNNPIDMAEKIIELLENPAKRETMGKFGRARVENELAWPYEAPKLLAAYEALFSKRRHKADGYEVVLVGPYPEDPAYIKGGVQASVYGLARNLRKTQNVKIISLPLKAGGAFRETAGITHLNAPYKFLFSSLIHLPHVMRSIAATKNPVLHVHGTGFFQAALCVIARLKDWPLVWTLHGITEKETWQHYQDKKSIGNFAHYLFYRTLERACLRLAPHVIVDTPYVVEALPYAQEDPHIIPQGIATQEFAGLAEQSRKGSTILSLGVIDPRKGHHITLEAFALVRRHVPDAKLVIAGSLSNPFYGEYLKQKAKELRLHDAVEIVANAPRAKILRLLDEARIMALHSREESQGIALCEALAAGLPVVSTYSGGIPYVVEDGETGLLVDYGNTTKFAEAMLRLLTDHKLHKTMSAKAYTASAKFEWTHITEKISKLYRQALAA